jgi:hypothetical protein
MHNRSSRNPTVGIVGSINEVLKTSTPKKKRKNPAAVALGRLGGLKGGVARAQVLSRAERVEIARRAAQARWQKD